MWFILAGATLLILGIVLGTAWGRSVLAGVRSLPGRGAAKSKLIEPLLLPIDVVVDRQLSTDGDLDLFEYGEIAGRVAELVAGADEPVHVGVFGAWGTGKSSFLTLVHRRLDELAGKVLQDKTRLASKFLVVRYDAWRYGGQALRRDLIAVAARELKVRRRRYRSGLFESRQAVRLEMDDFIRRLTSFLIGVAFLGLALTLVAVLGLAALWAISHFWDTVWTPRELVVDHSPPWGKVLAWMSALLAVLSAPNLLGVTVNRSSPSQDDEFARNLKSLIREAELVHPLRPFRRWSWLQRHVPSRFRRKVLFFIDELDRASDSEVLDTLTALQTQFADAGVSVVVAADRDVLEKALSNRERQRRPDREWDPYLSGSDAFLDKVFQHTFVLPPLRTERVTNYARDLVSRDVGLWSDIAAEGMTDHVLYALIPSHVHSPRRIKVLLNAYATQSRVAQARGLGVVDLRLQLAMWVVIQLEFPAFAADLKIEQSLRRTMLDETSHTGKLGRMLAQHRRIAEPASDAEDSEWVAWSYKNQLFDYLESTKHLPEIPFELLFLESAGSAIGKFGEEIATTLDRANAADPDRILSSLKDLDEETADRAILFLAESSRVAISVGRDRVIRVMAGLIEMHSAAPIAHAASALEAFRRYTASTPPPPEAVVGQIRTYVEAANADDLVAMLSHLDEREDVVSLEKLLGRLTLPDPTPPSKLAIVSRWLLEEFSPSVLAAIVHGGMWQILNSCVEANVHAVLRSIIEGDDLVGAESASPGGKAIASSSTAASPVDPDEEADEEAAPATLDTQEYRAICDWLSEGAATSLSEELATWISAETMVPAITDVLVGARALAMNVRGLLAATVLAQSAETDYLGQWVDFAVFCTNQELRADAARAVLRCMTVAGGPDQWTALLEQAARLLPATVPPSVCETAAEVLADAGWPADDGEARVELGALLISWLLDLGALGAGELCYVESEQAIVQLLGGTLSPETALPLASRLSEAQLADLDAALVAGGDAPAKAMRSLEARLMLRRTLPVGLDQISPRNLGLEIAKFNKVETDDTYLRARDRVVAEWFRAVRTDKEVIALSTATNMVWGQRLATWMTSTSAARATNVWIYLSRNNYSDATVRRVVHARQLDSAKVEKRMRELAGSDKEGDRQKAVQYAKHFPKGRADSDRAVQAVADELRHRDSADRKQAVRLVADYVPRRLSDSIVDFIADAPKYFFSRQSDKSLLSRIKKGKGS